MKRIILLIVPLIIMSLACQSQAVDPAPAPAALAPQKLVQSTVTAPKTAQVCLTVDTVRLRMGAGTSYGEVATLTGLDVVTITGTSVITEDMGVWMPVTFGAVSGWVNARYLC